jgi:hypothetical protein
MILSVHNRFVTFYARGEEMCIGFWWKSQMERDHQEDLDAGGKILLKLILER